MNSTVDAVGMIMIQMGIRAHSAIDGVVERSEWCGSVGKFPARSECVGCRSRSRDCNDCNDRAKTGRNSRERVVKERTKQGR